MVDLHPDPLREVRVAKRWALAGILGAVLVLLPIYGLTLGLTAVELGFVLSPAAVTAFIAIELASRWEYRMRRRYAYPHQLGYELACIHEFPRACQRSAQLIGRWLQAHAVVVAWLTEDGQALAPVAAYGLPGGWLEDSTPVSLGGRTLREALQDQQFAFKRGAVKDPWFGGHFDDGQVICVPLVSRERPEGVLAIAAPAGNSEVRDQRLLAALGMVMGLALDNCRLYEGQRAHTEHLQELNRMKSDFLTTVSHELRTPLTSIMLAAEMLMEDEQAKDPESPAARLVHNIVKGASRLSSLVADLVNISREDEFKPRLELDRVALADLVASAMGIIQPLVAAKHQTAEVRLEAAEAAVFVDRLRFEQVLINLLSNAQRYSPRGGHIVVSTRSARGETVISVTDSGPGVPVEDRELIFEPFYRGDRSGLGLGLAIAKSLVELHNGRIWVESAENGQGSSFCIALPDQTAGRPRPLASPVAR
ncbi:MAG: ATP-binding protein [Dehalococcoidia bacterium]|nr:ATP-binding protein [Dehalococcoidia bacterium]